MLALIAVLIVILIVAYFLWKKFGSGFTEGPYKPQWYGGASGEYTCPHTLANGWCILSEPDAKAWCKQDPNCTGYLKLEDTPQQAGWGMKNNVAVINNTPVYAAGRSATFVQKNK